MIGAIIGDIVGSRFEFNNYRHKDFELFTDECEVTDDSILTLAIAKAIMETEKEMRHSSDPFDSNKQYEILERQTIKYVKEFGIKYPDAGYGGMFRNWLFQNQSEPYNSFGNGAAMRVSPVGYYARTIDEVYRLSKCVTGITHNHEEGLKGAEATAFSIFLCRCGYHQNEVKKKVEEKYYNLNFTIDEIRDEYQFNETCQNTVPQAIVAFLESTSFEDAIRIAISLGGDSDTIGAITGSIAQAYYGVSEDLELAALKYLDKELREVYSSWKSFLNDKKI